MLENPTGPNYQHMSFKNYASQTYEVNFYRKVYSQAFQNNWIHKFGFIKLQILRI